METPVTGHGAFRAARDKYCFSGRASTVFILLPAIYWASVFKKLLFSWWNTGVLGYYEEWNGNLERHLWLQEYKLCWTWTLRSGFRPSALQPSWSVRELTSSSFRLVRLSTNVSSRYYRLHRSLEPNSWSRARLGPTCNGVVSSVLVRATKAELDFFSAYLVGLWAADFPG